MSLPSAEYLLQRLHENGVRRIYGYPGDGINAIVGALERQKDLIEFVQVRHEEQAGPGAIHREEGDAAKRLVEVVDRLARADRR